MNATMRVGLVFLSLFTAAFAAETEVRVASSRGLQLAVVDAAKPSAARDAVHQAFAASLGDAVSKRCGSPIGVRVKCVGADHAAFNLNAGVYDAVLVVAKSLPEGLAKVDGITLSAVPQSGKRDRTIFLIVSNGDASLQGMLASAFATALNDERFLTSFSGNEQKVAVANGTKVASSAP